MCRYFDEPGGVNTPQTVKIAVARAGELGIKKIVVFSLEGETALEVLKESGGDFDVIVVSRQYGAGEPGAASMPAEARKKLRDAGATVIIATEPLTAASRLPGCPGAGAAIRALEMFGSGVRTCVEMAMTCADAGIVNTTICRNGEILTETDEEVVCVTGDTACVIRPTDSAGAWNSVQWHGGVRVKEILCRPSVTGDGGEVECRYFEKLGKMNTTKTIEIAVTRAKEIGCRKIAVASISGWLGLKMLVATMDSGIEVIVMGRQYGLAKAKHNKIISEETKEKILAGGGRLLFSTIAVGGIARMPGCDGAAVARDTLMMFSPGMKVCVETAIMCADAGLVNAGEELICVAGTKAGADTAVVILPSTSTFAWDGEHGLRIKEVLCKPR